MVVPIVDWRSCDEARSNSDHDPIVSFSLCLFSFPFWTTELVLLHFDSVSSTLSSRRVEAKIFERCWVYMEIDECFEAYGTGEGISNC